MNPGFIAAVTVIGALMAILAHIVTAVYFYGRLTQRVDDLTRRVGRLEDRDDQRFVPMLAQGASNGI